MQGPEEDAGLAGKVALVSGGGAASDGIGNGRAAAVLLGRAGTKVVVADRGAPPQYYGAPPNYYPAPPFPFFLLPGPWWLPAHP